MTRLRLIAALDRQSAIGRDNRLPWHLPDDLKRFKALTLGHPVLMGRKTAESLGRALPKRRNLVLTRQDRVPFDGMTAVASLEQAMSLAGADDLWVIGGGEVYALCLPFATSLHLTHVDTTLVGADAWFPLFDESAWAGSDFGNHDADATHAFAFRFVDYSPR